MINKMDKYSIINLRKKGDSFRKIAKELSIDRKTVARVCKEFDQNMEMLINDSNDGLQIETTTERITGNIVFVTLIVDH